MKKVLLLICPILLFTGCSEEKNKFEQAVLAQMTADPDIQDYKLSPERMTECVVDLVNKKLPGLFVFDPRRQPYYTAYTKIITLQQSANPKQELLDIQEALGSKQAVMEARMTYTQSELNCVTALVSETEQGQQ